MPRTTHRSLGSLPAALSPTSGTLEERITLSTGAIGRFVTADDPAAADGFEVEILGHLRPARLVTEPLYDPAGERMRG